jgi:hypothetical protein
MPPLFSPPSTRLQLALALRSAPPAARGALAARLSGFASSKAKGDALELRVARIARLLGHADVRRNVVLVDSGGRRSEADVAFGGAWPPRPALSWPPWPLRRAPTFVECKNYGRGGAPVGLEEVAKWKAVLELNKVPLRRGLFVTTSRFSPRAREIGVRCLDGDELDAWEARARAMATNTRLHS